MVKTAIEALYSFLSDWLSFLPPGLSVFLASAYLVEGRYFGAFKHEFIGTLIMIMCTFSAGKWIGSESMQVAWLAHAMGVVAADKLGGGPQVNPAVTVAMWSLGKVTYTEGYVRMSGQLAGGLIAFPLYHAISNALKLTPFGGPEFGMGNTTEAFLSEFSATVLLCWAIYLLNWEIHFGKYHYWIKQTLTAVAIRALIELFPTAGPAMNPMLATAWAVFGVDNKYEYPTDIDHYFVYWVSPFLAAVTASALYVVYAGGTLFGKRLPLGPLKGGKVKKT